MSGSPLEIPRLIITPSTPQDDPPSSATPARRPKLAVTTTTHRTLLDQIDSAPTSSSPSSRSRGRKDYLSPTSHPTSRAGARGRPGRGTAASLVFIALAFMLVVSSALLSPETIVGLVPSAKGRGRGWMGSDRVEISVISTAPSDDTAQYTAETEFGGGDASLGDAGGGSTAGPVMSKDAWRSYLRRREQVTGQAGPTAHIEAWDFH